MLDYRSHMKVRRCKRLDIHEIENKTYAKKKVPMEKLQKVLMNSQNSSYPIRSGLSSAIKAEFQIVIVIENKSQNKK